MKVERNIVDKPPYGPGQQWQIRSHQKHDARITTTQGLSIVVMGQRVLSW